MIKRMYIDNYKCFVNFELHLSPITVIMGDNGTGKSTILDILDILRTLIIERGQIQASFPDNTRTKWEKRKEQRIEIDVEGNGGIYKYFLIIEQNPEIKKTRIIQEELLFDRKFVYSMKYGEAQLYRDDFKEGPKYPTDWSVSGLTNIHPPNGNKHLLWFKERIGKFFCVRINPFGISNRSESEDCHPERSMSNFLSWFRHLTLDMARSHRLLESLQKGVFENLQTLKADPVGDDLRKLSIVLGVGSPNNEKAENITIDYSELSDGQRCLIILYTLLYEAVGENKTLLIDEPNNYIALPEIQPWLLLLQDELEDSNGQALLISHHPELIDHLALDYGIRLYRESNGPVRCKKFEVDVSSGLSASELVARGWDNG